MQQRFPFLTALWDWNRGKMVTLLILLGLVLGALLWQSLWIEPTLQQLRDSQLSLQQKVRQRQLDYANSGIPVSVAERLQQQMEQFNQRIPERKDLSVFLGELYFWADEAGLSIDQIGFNPELDKETGLLRYDLNFNVAGDYSHIRKFIHLLEQAPRILIIDKIGLSGRQASQKKAASVSLSISLTTYFREVGV